MWSRIPFTAFQGISGLADSSCWLLREYEVKSLIPQRFDGCRCHKAFPDQLHTFVGDCGSDAQVVALVPEGDVLFPSNKIGGNNIIAVIGENVSADYLDFLEDRQISYVFAGQDGKDVQAMKARLKHDFGIETVYLMKCIGVQGSSRSGAAVVSTP